MRQLQTSYTSPAWSRYLLMSGSGMRRNRSPQQKRGRRLQAPLINRSLGHRECVISRQILDACPPTDVRHV